MLLCRCSVVPLVCKRFLAIHQGYPPECKCLILEGVEIITKGMIKWCLQVARSLRHMTIDLQDHPIDWEDGPRSLGIQLLALTAPMAGHAPRLRELKLDASTEFTAHGQLFASLGMHSCITKLELGIWAFDEIRGGQALTGMRALKV